MEWQRIDILLSQHCLGQYWLHVFQNTKSHQRPAPDMGARDKRVLCAHGQQVREKDTLSSFNRGSTRHFHRLVNSLTPELLHFADYQTVWTGLQATYDSQIANGGEGNPAIARGVLAMIFLYSLSYNIGWNPLQVTYVVEILPYHLRAKARLRFI